MMADVEIRKLALMVLFFSKTISSQPSPSDNDAELSLQNDFKETLEWQWCHMLHSWDCRSGTVGRKFSFFLGGCESAGNLVPS